MRTLRFIAVLVLAFATPAFAHDVAVKPLTPAQVPALLAPPAHGERIIMLWALECRYCEPNMQALAKLERAHPSGVQLVLVATDNIARRHEIAARLDAAGMQRYPARAYTDPTPTRMNYLVDPGWGGAMPRTLVVRADGSQAAISGLLTPAQLKRIAPR